ncbi:hypothetical protein DMENIID0001_117040 [Sergentomyia squamirostris]
MFYVRISFLLLASTCVLAIRPEAIIVDGLLKAAAIKGALLHGAALKAAAIKGLAIRHLVIPAVADHLKTNKAKYINLGKKFFAPEPPKVVHIYKEYPHHSWNTWDHHEEDKHEHHHYEHKHEIKHEDKGHHYGYHHANAYQEGHINHDAHWPHYSYKYGVDDHHTGDHKSAWESRLGDHVKGEYTLREPDGTKRIVSYSADPKEGFVAHVKNVGTPQWASHSHFIAHTTDLEGNQAPPAAEASAPIDRETYFETNQD